MYDVARKWPPQTGGEKLFEWMELEFINYCNNIQKL